MVHTLLINRSGLKCTQKSEISLGSVQVLRHRVMGGGGLYQNDDNDDALEGVGGLGLK